MVRAKNYGRMGNTMFQNFTAISYALKHGHEFSIPTISTSGFWNPLYLQELANPNWCEGIEDVIIRETQHEYVPLPYEKGWDNCQIVLDGYWQSENYFIEHRAEILRLMDFCGYEWKYKHGWVALHNRLGDYKQHADRHHNISDEYIASALKIMHEKGANKILVFSDGMEETKERVNNKIYPKFHFEYSENKSEIEDMKLGSYCQHNIISASTFSWMQAWLGRNEDKVVIAPKGWFEHKNIHLNDKDIVPERWLRI